jgi:hypothetical protein
MERREFIEKSGCGMLGLFAGSAVFGSEQTATPAPAQTPPAPWSKPYRIDLEIFEARTDSFCHQKGDKFAYPRTSRKSARGSGPASTTSSCSSKMESR